MERRRSVGDETGGAIVEFHFLGILLLVPVVYILLTVLDVQRSSYGVTQAAREAGRMYVATGDEAAARLAATVALRDQGVDPAAVSVTLSCSVAPCYQPGAEITVTIDTDVALPLIPDVIAGVIHTEVPVSASHVAVIDRYRSLE